MDEQLTSTYEVIAALGGPGAVAELTRRKYNAAWNWTQAEHFPANTYVVMNDALQKIGKRAPATLWRMAEPVS